jgi:hypothetical protein
MYFKEFNNHVIDFVPAYCIFGFSVSSVKLLLIEHVTHSSLVNENTLRNKGSVEVSLYNWRQTVTRAKRDPHVLV